MSRYVTTNVRFPEATYRELQHQAGRRRMPLASLVREAVDRYLGRADDASHLPFGEDPADVLVGCVPTSGSDESVNHDHYTCTAGPWRSRVKLLVDTSALLALLLRDDQHHEAAVAFVRAHPHARFVLSELILAEVATRIRAWAGAAQAVAVARGLLDSRRYEVLLADAELCEEALLRMERFADKRLSLADCVSFALMDRLAPPSAFTFDADFKHCGYGMLP